MNNTNTDFVNLPSYQYKENVGTILVTGYNNGSSSIDGGTIEYDIYSNKYSMKFTSGMDVEMYSTEDYLKYCFGDNLNKVISDDSLYIIETRNNYDMIFYKGECIGFGANDDIVKECHKDMQKEIKEVIEDAVADAMDWSNNTLSGKITTTKTIPGILEAIDLYNGTWADNVHNMEDRPGDMDDINGGKYNRWDTETKYADIYKYAFVMVTFMYHSSQIQDGAVFKPSKAIEAVCSLLGLVDNQLSGIVPVGELGKLVSNQSEMFLVGQLITGDNNLEGYVTKFGDGRSFEDWASQFTEGANITYWEGENHAAGEEFAIPSDYGLDFEAVISNYLPEQNESEELTFDLKKMYKDELPIDINDKINSTIKIGAAVGVISGIKLVKTQFNSARSIAYDPLILDLDGDGFNIEKKGDGANFDLDKNGFAEKINWTSRDGFLCLDLNENGIIDNGGELFGDQTLLADGKTAKNGFEALKQYDSNGDGVIDENDEIFSQLRVWVDADGNGISDEGEMKTLKELGIASINLNYENVNAETGTEATIGNTATFTREDGTTASVGELWVASDLYDTVETVNVEISEEIAKLPDFRSLGNVYSLHTAMALDETGELKGLVESFVSEEDIDRRIEIAEQILFFISGAKDIAADSRGGNMDARQLVVIEAMLGEKYVGTNGTNPNPNAASILEKAYQDLLNMYFNELNVQAYLKDYAPLFRYTENEDGTKKLNFDLYNLVLKYQIKNGDENVKKILVESARYVQYLNNSGIKGTEQFVVCCMEVSGEYGVEAVKAMSNGYAADGENPLNGTNDADILAGSNNDDEIYGNNGNDILVGGKGNDHLEGGVGNDIYIFNKGDGEDTIVESMRHWYDSPEDRILFGKGITVDDVVFSRIGNDLILTYGEGDVITVKDNYVNTNNNIEFVEFADGTVLNADEIADKARVVRGTSGDDVLTGRTASGGGRNDDIFYAGDGNDTVYGYDGNDVIVGGKGNDYLEGGTGNDTYIFNKGDGEDTIVESMRYWYDSPEDRILFGEEITVDDVVISRIGNDLILTYGEGDVVTVKDNYVHSNNNVEFIEFADGTILNADEIADRARIIKGTAGDDELEGFGGTGGGRDDEIFYAGDGNDIIHGNDGNDTIYGDDGDDTIYGGSGDDVIVGGTGNDYMEGGTGNDTYIFNKGDGEDTIVESIRYWYDSPEDKILFGEGITVDDVIISRTGNDLILTYGEGDVITVKDNYVHTNNNIEFIEFADGTVLNADEIADKARVVRGTSGDDVLTGRTASGGGHNDDIFYAGDGNDIVYGYDGNDIIVGGKGNDHLEGGVGNDTYIFNKGDGEDTIVESMRYWYDSPEDRIIFGEGITVDDVIISRTGNDLILTYGEGDVITVKDNYVNTNNNIEFVEFADGTVLNADEIADKARVVRGTSGDDVLTGRTASGGGRNDDIFYAGDGNDTVYGYDGNDVIVGGKGNDYLEGGTGNDTYIFNKGDGEDTIVESMRYWYDSPEDRILFGEEITVDDVVISRIGNDLILTYGEGDVVTVKDNYVHSNNNVEFIEFADGTILNADEIADRARIIKGTAGDDELEGFGGTGGGRDDEIFYAGDGNDIIHGNDGNDTIYGDDGDDTIYGGSGDDVIVGGTGNDYMEGGVGNDTYIFNKGDGEDTIVERMNYCYDSPKDRILFGEGITVDDVIISRTGNDLILTYGEGDVVTVKDNYVHTNNNVEFIEFADGTVLNADEIADRAKVVRGTSGDDVLTGRTASGGGHNDDIFYAGDGNDTVYGYDGNDIIVGGKGNDHLEGGVGNDTYIFNKGDGEDTIVERMNYWYDSPEDRILFGEGITTDDVVFSRNGNDLVISYSSEGDTVTVQDHYVHSNYSVESFETSDGYSISNTQVDLLIQSMAEFEADTGMSWAEAAEQPNQQYSDIISQMWVKTA